MLTVGPNPHSVKVLVVGAGGIGCELLKNLVLENFQHITIVDLDTIDISNLNRQFLFQRKHVGRSKAEVARESILRFRPNCEIIALHKSVLSSKFDTEFFSTFDIVFNALDNHVARRQVNRLCVAAQRPLVESGTAGYLGQVEPLIPTGLPDLPAPVHANEERPFRTGCYECQSRGTDQKTFPACTIRNTPSEPVHCVVWAKYLFNQLFGEPDIDDEDVSPDLNDPELQQNRSSAESIDHQSANNKPIVRDGPVTLHDWFSNLWKHRSSSEPSAARALAWRLFHQDIVTLIGMRDLWVDRQDRREPIPLPIAVLDDACNCDAITLPHITESISTQNTSELRDQRQLTQAGWLRLFLDSVKAIQLRLDHSDGLVLSWDKDDVEAMDFVAGAAILRAQLFHLPGADSLNRFVMKSLAGNIIPAIATTNAVIAGLMVLQAKQILNGASQYIRTVYMPRLPTGRRGNRRIVVPCDPPLPNPSCFVCSCKATKSKLSLVCDPSVLTLRVLRDRILIRHVGMLAPDVEVEDLGVILISSEDGETDEKTLDMPLINFQVKHGSRLQCDDFRQDFNLTLVISSVSSDVAHHAMTSNEKSVLKGTLDASDAVDGWSLVGDLDAVLTAAKSTPIESNGIGQQHPVVSQSPNGFIGSTDEPPNDVSDEPTVMVSKRPLSCVDSTERVEELSSPSSTKRRRTESVHLVDDEDDLICLN